MSTIHIQRARASSFPQTLRASRHAESRRGGQALLLAVLLMVFAALLGSTFVTVVALNLNRAARDQNKNEAKLAAQAGLRIINQQIVNSVEGENWRPEMVSPPPDTSPGSAGEYNVYYTPFEQAQGWGLDSFTYSASNLTDQQKWAELETYKNNGGRVFVKFPDPRGFSKTNNTPTYLAEVRRITNFSADKDGLLQISIIGRSADNDVVFARSEAYKGTPQNGNPFSFALYTGNYDTRTNRLLATSLTSLTPGVSTPSTATLVLRDRLDIEPGRTMMLWNGTSALTVIVNAVLMNGKQLDVTTVDGADYTGFGAGSQLRAAATLLDGLTSIDADGDGIADTGDSTIGYQRKLLTTHGIYANGAARVEQKLDLATDITGNIVTVPGPTDVAATAAAVVNSNTWSNSLKPPQVEVETSDSAADEVPSVRPVSLDTGGNSKYRKMTQGDSYAGAAYGYGHGLYIDNPSDIEKVATTTGGYRTLRDYELQRLWQRKSFTALTGDANPNVDITSNVAVTGTTNHRLAFPPAKTTLDYTYPLPAGSLEERGLRGWVSPFEYRPRGVQIDLRGDVIIVTRDHQSDASGIAEDTDRTWKDVDGNLITNTTNNYRMKLVINNPGTNSETVTRSFGPAGAETDAVSTSTTNGAFNGVIFAEGNVRIRGYLDHKDITVVSMGTVYVDGAIVRDVNNADSPPSTAPRIALLARRNVVLNPTQVLPNVNPRPGAIRTLINTITAAASAAAGGSSVTLTLNSNALQVGDQLQFLGAGSALYTVQGITGSTVSITPPLAYPVQSGRGVFVKFAGSTLGSTAPLAIDPVTGERYYKVGVDNTNPALGASGIVRDLRFDGVAPPATNNYFLTVLHAGQSKKAFDLHLDPGGLTSVPFHTKEDADTSGNIGSPEKTFVATDTSPLFNRSFTYDLLALPDTASADRGKDLIQNLDYLITKFNAAEQEDNGSGVMRPKWHIDNQDGNAANIAARRLAALGILNGTTDDPVATTATAVSVPLATSAGLYVHTDPTAPGVNPDITIGSAFDWTTLVPDPDPAVNPYPASDTPPLLPEVDQTTRAAFYQRDAAGTQAFLQWYTFPAALTALSTAPGASDITNLITFMPENNGFLPDYRVAQVRVESDDFASPGATPRLYAPAINVRVQATIFAQSGSWFVIPVPLNPVPDLNGDGATGSADELDAATRYRRLNYTFEVQGNIAQSFSPTATIDYDGEQDPDGQSTGAVGKWIDAASHPKDIKDDSGYGRGANWISVTYQADPIPVDSGLKLPVTPDLIYSTS